MHVTALVLAAFVAVASAQGDTRTDPDRLYADRANLASARRAAELWTDILRRNPRDFDAAWKLARADYWLGGHAPEAERKTRFTAGLDAARAAVAIDAGRPEGHFWMAANMGALAESAGLRAGLKYRGAIKEELETVLRIDPSFLQGSADRALGRWYFKVPGLFGGSRGRAEAHLRASLKYNPDSTASHMFLAELLIDQHRDVEARAELERVLAAPFDAEWNPEDQEFKTQARAMLAKLGR